MLDKLFGGKNIEKVLFFLLINEKCYATQLSRTFNVALSQFQKVLERLEDGNILISLLVGKTRCYQFNPRYPFLSELKIFLSKAYSFLPENQKDKFYESKIRKRPRKKGKPL